MSGGCGAVNFLLILEVRFIACHPASEGGILISFIPKCLASLDVAIQQHFYRNLI
jgi:hypothetical protein